MIRVDITVRVSANDAQACVACDDALMSAIGVSINSPLPTTQSNTFFKTPGTPWAYSGLNRSIAFTRRYDASAVAVLDQRRAGFVLTLFFAVRSAGDHIAAVLLT
jgi:hypothetical protein